MEILLEIRHFYFVHERSIMTVSFLMVPEISLGKMAFLFRGYFTKGTFNHGKMNNFLQNCHFF